jgi:serine/threonine protein kinase
MELRPGAVIAGRYRVDRKIGAGGMGEVWSGEHVNIGVRVALKTLLPAAALDRRLVARFRREAQLLGRTRSDRVARVVDFVEDRQFGLVLVMDFVEGELLGDVLGARRLGVDETIALGVDVVSALCDLHRAKVVHRDLKPDNIILEALHGGRRRAVIVDLGVSRLDAEPNGDDSPTSITLVDTAVGTLPYMAPEQLLSSSTATASADVYAVGAILYRAISGEQVFGEDDALAARRKITGEAPPLSLPRVDRVALGLAAIVARALRRHPEQRFASAEEMLGELTTLQDVSRAMSFDLEAATEEALPPTSMVLAASMSAPPTASSPHAAPSTETSGEPTRRMSRPPVDEGDLFDEETQLSPASQVLRRAAADLEAVPIAADPARSSVSPGSEAPVTSQVPATRPARATVRSPVMLEAPPSPSPTMEPVPGSLAVPPTVDEPAPPRTIRLRAALLGLLAALAAGTVLGFEAHRLVTPPPPIGAQR